MATEKSADYAFPTQVEQDLVEYRSVSVPAIVSLVLGLLAWLALVHPLLGALPALGIALALIALRQIGVSENTVGGRSLALVGLALCVFFAAMAVASSISYRTRLIRAGRPVAEQWFELLAADAPEKALQLESTVAARPPLDADVWSFYRNNPEAQSALRTFVDSPTIHALLLLGDRAEVAYFGTEAIYGDDNATRLSQVYSVTHEDDGRPATFFVRLILERRNQPAEFAGSWRVVDYQGGVRPFHEE